MSTIANLEKLIMSSTEIAELCEKRHDNVMRDIKEMLGQLEIDPLKFEEIEKHANNREREVFNLPKDLTITLVSGYNVKLRKKIIDRWLELEGECNEPKKIDFSNPLQVAGLLAQSLEQVQEQQARIEQDRPKVEFHDQVVMSEDALTIAEAAKVLGTGRTRLLSFMRQNKWVTRKNEPYQDRIEAGLLDVKLGSWSHPNHGIKQSVTALVTGKGLAKLQKIRSTTVAL